MISWCLSTTWACEPFALKRRATCQCSAQRAPSSDVRAPSLSEMMVTGGPKTLNQHSDSSYDAGRQAVRHKEDNCPSCGFVNEVDHDAVIPEEKVYLYHLVHLG